ncbi:MAG TPA: methylaspartate mutase subunit E [Longimicrobiaceae bacterium]|nr:methylaspartate mutase subunit E [Longimicrobiaceae bacterium]
MHIGSGHTILLGGVGGDSHSVGLTILRQALTHNGFRVHYLGTQNRLEDFFQVAALCNVVMISSMDGHTRYYLRDFPELMERYGARSPLWYLGGNLTIGDALGYEGYFREMGFDRVFVKFTDLRKVLATLRTDLHAREPLVHAEALLASFPPLPGPLPPAGAEERLDPGEFERVRREVLQHWCTGEQARDLEENARFLARQPSVAAVQALSNAGRQEILVQPRCGVPLVDDQIRLFQAFRGAGAGVLSYQVDSLTRNNDYAGADEAIRESRASGVATLNGFPVINHGIPALRRIVRAVGVPLQVRHSTRDPRLLAEISYAGGATSFEGGPICYNIPYYKDYPLAESIRNWRYVDHLTGVYHDRFGIVLDREYFGTLTATLIPPCLAISTGILETILAVRQGVKCVSLGYAEGGHRVQDVAAIRMLRVMAEEVLRNLGYADVQVNTVFHQYMAAFPDAPERAEELIFHSAVTARLSGATRVIVKTPVEAYRIPSLADNLNGLGLVMRGVAAAAGEALDEAAVQAESAMIRREVQSILDAVVLAGRGSVAEGIVAAFRAGILDIPFAPSVHNRGEVSTARDAEGAIRFLSFGSLPFDRELREFHRSRMDERRRREGGLPETQGYLLVERDVLQIPRGEYRRWPLSTGVETTAFLRPAERV